MAPHFVAGIAFRGNVVCRYAPILNWTRDKTKEEVMKRFEKRRWHVTRMRDQ